VKTVLDSDEEINVGALMEDAYLDDADLDDEEDSQSPTYTFKVANGRIQSMTDELDAMKQAVDKILQTERYVYQIYDEQYGNDLPELIGESINYAKSEAERMVVEALEADDRINNVEITKCEQSSSDAITVEGFANTVYGGVGFESEVDILDES
jgi:phage baseplate assembly protein W